MTKSDDTQRLNTCIHDLLEGIGEDPGREGLRDTPQRAAETLAFLTKGYHESVASLVEGAVFSGHGEQIVVVKNIELYSLCEHHLLPFHGKCHIAYQPDKHILGLSKLGRIVDLFARRLQIQEQLTQQIAQAIDDTLSPLGVGVVIECQHMCMMMRGIEKQHASMTTATLLGCFKTDPNRQQEFYNLIR